MSALQKSPIDLVILPRLIPMKIRDYLKQLTATLVCCAAMVVALLATRGLLSGWPGLLLSTVVGFVTYTAALRLVSPGSFREVTGILREVLRPT